MLPLCQQRKPAAADAGRVGKSWVVTQPRRAGTATLRKSDRFLGAPVQAFFLIAANFLMRAGMQGCWHRSNAGSASRNRWPQAAQRSPHGAAAEWPASHHRSCAAAAPPTPTGSTTAGSPKRSVSSCKPKHCAGYGAAWVGDLTASFRCFGGSDVDASFTTTTRQGRSRGFLLRHHTPEHAPRTVRSPAPFADPRCGVQSAPGGKRNRPAARP